MCSRDRICVALRGETQCAGPGARGRDYLVLACARACASSCDVREHVCLRARTFVSMFVSFWRLRVLWNVTGAPARELPQDYASEPAISIEEHVDKPVEVEEETRPKE